jgi:hypothetical protein
LILSFANAAAVLVQGADPLDADTLTCSVWQGIHTCTNAHGYTLVGLASALIILISKYGFTDVLSDGRGAGCGLLSDGTFALLAR